MPLMECRMTGQGPTAVAIDTGKPHPAQMYD